MPYVRTVRNMTLKLARSSAVPILLTKRSLHDLNSSGVDTTNYRALVIFPKTLE